MRRGVTSFWIGSVPRARMASICSVTFMEPSSLAMPEALRPATMSAVSTGPSSRTSVMETSVPVLPDLAVSGQGLGHLQRHDGAGEEPGDGGDHQAAHADGVHLQNDVVAVMRACGRCCGRPGR